MKLIALFLLAMGPTWSEYATHNSRYTCLLHALHNVRIDCLYPGEDGRSLCIGKGKDYVIVLKCPVDRFTYCQAWKKEL